MKYTIDVTAEDIENGRPHSTSCPVALAITRATGTPAVVTGSPFSFPVYRACGNLLPSEVQLWIKKYDLHYDVLPFSFDLEIP